MPPHSQEIFISNYENKSSLSFATRIRSAYAKYNKPDTDRSLPHVLTRLRKLQYQTHRSMGSNTKHWILKESGVGVERG